MKNKLLRAIALGLLLSDTSPNQIQAAAPTAPQGIITDEIYLNIGGGTTVADLTGSAKFIAATPDYVRYEPYFEYFATGDIGTVAPSDVLTSSGARMAGYFYPPTTGDYVFFIAADDGANLYLSTDDNPANKKLIAVEAGYSGNRSYTAIGGTSTVEAKNSSTFANTAWATKDPGNGGAKITLTAGKAYYIEALQKEGGGGDNLSVAVQDPNGAIDSSMPIPGAYLSSLKSNGPVTFTIQPQSQTVGEGTPVSFTVDVQGTPPLTFQWTRSSANITDATNSTYAIARTPFSDNGVKFACKVTGAVGPATSADALLTVTPDTTSPAVTKVTSDTTFIYVAVNFSEPVSDTALTASNYKLDQGITVSSVARVNASTVTLTTSKMAEGSTFNLTINGVQDTAATANTLAANTKVVFQTFMFWNGSVLHKKYDNVTDAVGSTTDGLFTDPRYPSSPDRVDLMTMWEYPAAGAGRVAADPARNYFDTLEGFVSPTNSGNYVFFLAGADRFWLFLSTDDSPANMHLIAAEPDGWSDPRGWMQAYSGSLESRRSDQFTGTQWPPGNTIALTAGKRYYMMSVHHDPSWCGADEFGVTYKLDTEDDPVDGVAPKLTGSNIGTYVDPTGASIAITKQPVAVTAQETRPAKFTITAAGTTAFGSMLFYQWQKNQVDIPGATADSYATPVLAMSDNGTKYRCILTVPGKQVTSDEVTLAVIADTFPPIVLGAGALMNTNNTWEVGVQFDEPVDTVSAGLQANYLLSAGAISGLTLYTNMADQPGVTLAVSGLTAGSKYTVTVKNVADMKGNKIGTATKEFTASKMTWGEVGADQLALGPGAGYGVVPVAENSFDLYSDGISEWGTYDEATFVYEKVTGNFDKMLRVEYQDLSSQWARAGLIARDVTNFGVDTTIQTGDGSNGTAGRYQKVHVNPQGPTLTGPGTAGNNNWEGNRRLDTGLATTSALVYNGRAPVYPNAWCRIVRDGQIFSIYRSDDGKAWTLLGVTDWAKASVGGAMPASLFVGPEFSPENGNIPDVASRGRFLAQIRDYGDTPALFTTDTTANKRKAVFLGPAKFTPNMGGHSGITGDYALDLGIAGGAMAQVTDPTFLNAPAANDELSFSVWVKRYDINDSSAFWVRSRQNPVSTDTPGNSDRAFQAHVPWSDNVVAFDTVGCCDPALQRISANATTASGYTGLGWWTNNWHHWVFTKKADQKNIYVDGKLFLNGSSSNPLPIDIGEFMIGAETGTGNSMHAKVDDFAVFGKELTLAQANSLFTGTAPSAISGAQLLAFWNFNDAPATSGVAPTLSAVKGPGGYIITFTGTLESALAITGPWTPETGTGSVTVPFTGTAKYFRAKQ